MAWSAYPSLPERTRCFDWSGTSGGPTQERTFVFATRTPAPALRDSNYLQVAGKSASGVVATETP
jgi:hypothetical protein